MALNTFYSTCHLGALSNFLLYHLHWQSLLAKPLAIAARDSHMTVTFVLALAAFGITTINRNDHISIVPPKVAKAYKRVTAVCHCSHHYHANLFQCKGGFMNGPKATMLVPGKPFQSSVMFVITARA
jgi:hypothetical protein